MLGRGIEASRIIEIIDKIKLYFNFWLGQRNLPELFALNIIKQRFYTFAECVKYKILKKEEAFFEALY